jgi:hypothetical protein
MAVSGTPSTTRWDYGHSKTCECVLNDQQSAEAYHLKEKLHTEIPNCEDDSIFYQHAVCSGVFLVDRVDAARRSAYRVCFDVGDSGYSEASLRVWVIE